MRTWLEIILSCGAIGAVTILILSDPWWSDTLAGRFTAVLLVSAGAWGIWIGGVSHGIKLSRESMENTLEGWEND